MIFTDFACVRIHFHFFHSLQSNILFFHHTAQKGIFLSLKICEMEWFSMRSSNPDAEVNGSEVNFFLFCSWLVRNPHTKIFSTQPGLLDDCKSK